MVTRDQLRAFYGRLGSRVDWGRWYAEPAVEDLLAHAGFEDAGAVFELGCGTGRLAERLLDRHLPDTASYLGVDLTPAMVGLARTRLGRFEGRAEVRLTEGDPTIDAAAGAYDRFVCTYVIELLTDDEIRAVLAEAHRVLAPGGLLGVVSLRNGCTFGSRLITRAWETIHRLRPTLTGGCRPIELLNLLPDRLWDVRHHDTVIRYGIPSEVVVAAKIE